MRLLLDRDLATFARAPAASDMLLDVPPEHFARATARTALDTGIDLTTARARAGFTRGHLLSIVVYSAQFSAQTAIPVRNAAELVVRRLLGDAITNDWVGEIDAVPIPRASALRVLGNLSEPEQAFALCELRPAVCAAIRGVQAGLPERACHERLGASEWTLFELEPEIASEFAAQDDLVISTSMLPEMLKCFLQGARFCSERFSRHGELFCYLKYESAEPSFEARLAERIRYEDALTAMLQAARLGAVVGNGLGLRYSYLHLALLRPHVALIRVSEVLRKLGLPRRSWVLFCDSDHADNWLGIWPDSPAPPLLEA